MLMRKARRVAIVGGGPRGLFALDCLSALANESPDRTLDITLFEPAASVGAGAVYAPDQPSYLLMNFATGMIDAWDRSFAANAHRPSLLDWLGETHPDEADANTYVPRARVGDYLLHCFTLLREQLPDNVTLKVASAFVSRITRGSVGWLLEYRGGAASFDEVLVVTGHQRWQGVAGQEASSSPPMKAFPAGPLAAAYDRLAGTVRCKGFGLTFIDVALTLTVGRGGCFIDSGGGQRVYRASGREPTHILPISRTGRPVLPKPQVGVVPMNASRRNAVDTLLRALSKLPVPITDFVDQVWPLFCRAADAFIDTEPGQTAQWFNAWQSASMGPQQAIHRLRKAWRIATGRTAPDPGIALALVWRAAYPQLVRVVSHGGMTSSAVPGFRHIATEMERIAFGPPAENTARLLGLIDAGIVGLPEPGSARPSAVFDVDATLPGPAVFDTQGPLAELVASEKLSRTALGTLAIDNVARPLKAETGQPVQGLAIVGRVTELSVLGNDTLSRSLHPILACWAAQVWGLKAP